MILDYLKNASLYSYVNARIETAFQFLRDTDFTEMNLGKYNIDSDKLYAIVNEYETKPIGEGILEAHRKYIDIHYILAGSECIATTFLTDQVPTKDYDEQDDYMLFSCASTPQLLIPGMFALLYPHDIHMPGVHVAEKKFVRKVVVKVMV
jgi:YhcH/YjgK/YiaL family protein